MHHLHALPARCGYSRVGGFSARRRFTLIELLVVIAIIAVLTAILFPVLGRTREMARRTVCQSNQHQMGIALYLYSDDNDSFFPNNSYRDYCGSEHIVQINDATRRAMMMYIAADPVITMRCPNDQWKKFSTDFSNCGWLFGYDVMVGHSDIFATLVTSDTVPWTPPRQNNQDPSLVMMSDTGYATPWFNTLASHGKTGPVSLPNFADPRYYPNGMQGTFVLTLDGAVTWRPVKDVEKRIACNEAIGSVMAFW